jgi:hypothetical protein
MALIGHSHLNGARQRKILLDFLYLQRIFLTVEVDWKITIMSGQEFVRLINNVGNCIKNQGQTVMGPKIQQDTSTI